MTRNIGQHLRLAAGGRVRCKLLEHKHRRLDAVPDRLLTQIQQLTVPKLEDLGEALLDFTSLVDLEGWLSQNSQ